MADFILIASAAVVALILVGLAIRVSLWTIGWTLASFLAILELMGRAWRGER